MNLNLTKLRDDLFQQYMQKLSDIISNHIENKTVTGYFKWYDDDNILRESLLTLKVDKVFLKGHKIYAVHDNREFHIYMDQILKILD